MVTCYVLLARENDSHNVSIHTECQFLLNAKSSRSSQTDTTTGTNRNIQIINKRHLETPVINNGTKVKHSNVDIAKDSNVDIAKDSNVDIVHVKKEDPKINLRLAEDRTVFDGPAFKSYIMLRKKRVNPHDFPFLLTGRQICAGKAPTLMIMVMSEYFHVDERKAIRETYGSVVATRRWPLLDIDIDVKLAFIFGSPEKSMAKYTIATEEDKHHGDVIMVDYKDTYNNLTRKIMMSMKWVSTFCPNAKFMLKIDEDTFVHLGNLVPFLKTIKVPPQGIIIGHGVYRSAVLRTGRWLVRNETYPFPEFPPYTSGNTYVISGNIVARMFFAAEYLPYVTIEDAFLTGIVREAVGAEMLHKVGFTWWEQRAPRLCGFHNKVRISGTNCDIDLMYKIWKAIHSNKLKNCYDPTRFEKPVYV